MDIKEDFDKILKEAEETLKEFVKSLKRVISGGTD
jgi:uncharacterized protein with von Willebrand factor type A (vWA) domain